MKILSISPTEDLKNSIDIVTDMYDDISIDSFLGDLQEGKEIAISRSSNKYDAIISRGGTADLIRKHVNIPVIDVSLSLYDILGTIKLAHSFSDNFAIIGFRSITEPAHVICDILDMDILIITIKDISDLSDILLDLKKQNFDMLVCDSIVNKMASGISLNTMLVSSGTESIDNAIKEAIYLINLQSDLKEEITLLKEVFNNFNQHIILFDQYYNIYYSNVNNSLNNELINFISKKEKLPDENNIYYNFSYEENVYNLSISKLIYKTPSNIFMCSVNKSSPPVKNSKYSVTFQSIEEINTTFSSNVFSQYVLEQSVISKLENYARYKKPIIIMGENGVGKDYAAYKYFLALKERNNNFITVDCSNYNSKLLEYLLNPADGPFVEEDNTIFVKNLSSIEKSGIEEIINSITSTKLSQRNNIIFSITNNEKNADFALNVLKNNLDIVTSYLKPTRERRNELDGLVTLLINRLNNTYNKNIIGFEPDALSLVKSYEWPENYKQLIRVLTELIINSNQMYITQNDVYSILNKEHVFNKISSQYALNSSNSYKKQTLDDYIYDIIHIILEQNDGNQTKAAKELNISRTTVWKYLKNNHIGD